MKYAEVILPLPLYSTFTYKVPDTMADSLSIGFRVLVPFGRKKFYTGIVEMLHNRQPEGYEVKEIISVLDSNSILRHPQLKFWQWISEYYLCSLGEVYKAAVPAGMKVESETYVSTNPDFIDSDHSMKERETVIYDLLSTRDKLTPADIAKATGYKNVEAIVASMIEKEAIFISEKIVDNYRPKTEIFVKLNAEKGDNEKVGQFFEAVKSAKKQEAALLAYLDLSKWMQRGEAAEVSREALKERSEASNTILKAMSDKGIFTLYKKEINRFASNSSTQKELTQLSDIQQKALNEITESFKTHGVTLQHGLTSSRKTEI